LLLVNRKPGTYGIYCGVNNLIYIGSSIDLSKRLKNFFSPRKKNFFGRHLENNNSSGRSGGNLRADLIKYGPEKFQFIVFDVIEPVSATKNKLELDMELVSLERELIRLLPQNLLYNRNYFPGPRCSHGDVGVIKPLVINDEMVAIERRLDELKLERRSLITQLNAIKLQLNPELAPSPATIMSKPVEFDEIRALRRDIRVKATGVPVSLTHILTK
jgi:hypothetical protein